MLMYLSRSIDNLLLANDLSKFREMDFGPGYAYAESDTHLIRYRLCGSGDQTIVFIPNAPNMIEHYDRLVLLLSPHFKVLIFELPGFGFSLAKKLTYNYSIDSCTDLTIQLLDKLGLKQCILAFPCISGFIALKMAEKRPDLVSSIVSIQTLCWTEQEQWAQNINKRIPLKTPVQGHFYFWFGKEKVAQRWYERVIPNESIRTGMIQTALENFKKGAHYTLASAFQGIFNAPPPPLKPTDIRALIIWGSADKSHQQQSKWSMLQYLQNFEPIEFEDAGHFPELERPERFARKMVERFVLQPEVVTTAVSIE